MEIKKIKRRVVILDNSNQMSLFAEFANDVTESDPEQKAKDKDVVFHEPDPRAIYLNGVRLDEYLQQIGSDAALKVRKLMQGVDCSAMESRYKFGGRRPYAPRAMIGLILYGLMKGVNSLRDLEQFARVDLGCMWISGGICPDHSILGRFIQQHAELLTEEFFLNLTRQVLKATKSTTQRLAGDGTVIEAAASHYRTVKAEALQEQLEKARQAAAQSPEETAHAKRVGQLEQAQEILAGRKAVREAKGKNAEKMQIHPNEPEAVIQPLKDKKRFAPSYKPSVLANENRIITAQTVDGSSETGVVSKLLDQAGTHGTIEQTLFDAGYHAAGVIEAHKQRNIELLCPEGRSQGNKTWNKQSEKYYPKSSFTYDAQEDSYCCPEGQKLTRISVYKGNETHPGYRLYGSNACLGCEKREYCTKSATGRRIKRYSEDEAKEALREKMQQSHNRDRYIKRQAMVEPVFSQLKGKQGLNRFRRKGLKAVCCEFALHAMAYNLSRAVVLWEDFFVFYRHEYKHLLATISGKKYFSKKYLLLRHEWTDINLLANRYCAR